MKQKSFIQMFSTSPLFLERFCCFMSLLGRCLQTQDKYFVVMTLLIRECAARKQDWQLLGVVATCQTRKNELRCWIENESWSIFWWIMKEEKTKQLSQNKNYDKFRKTTCGVVIVIIFGANSFSRSWSRNSFMEEVLHWTGSKAQQKTSSLRQTPYTSYISCL